MRVETLAVYGVGLLGGSVGMAARRRGTARRVIGIGRSADRLKRAVDLGAITEATTDLEQGLAEADWVVLASTVSHIVELMPHVAAACRPSALVTDVGSTKATIVAEAERVFAGTEAVFVGSHPMAGSEQSGVACSSPDLFQDACCIVTKSDRVPAAAIDRVEEFWQSLGARTVRLGPAEHDRLISRVSHLPHLAAVALQLATVDDRQDLDVLAALVGQGFRDTTRVAEGPSGVWRDICLENCGPITDDLDRLAKEIQRLTDDIREGRADSLVDRFERARLLRKRLVP